ncbi:hypothetical protein L6241_07475 [Janibacter sp. Y6]|uniref:hypothetical protein n=1 Tax=Janibacter sp. Y6 TaxID=2913552 RepID=UPI0034A4075F
MLTYAEWCEGLFNHLVGDGAPQRPLYLFVDRDDLAAVAQVDDEEAALLSFARAYRERADREAPFRFEYQLARSSDPSDQAVPPYFLALVMSVLAVTEAPIGAAHGIYRRQNDLLGHPPTPSRPPGYADHVPFLWQAWNNWLSQGGRRFGTSTARSHPHWTHQGWARSQGLFRQQDRLLVQDWFEDRGVRPGDHMSRDHLVQGFLSWLTFRRSTGQALLQRVRDDAAKDVLADLLETELRTWTGQVSRSGGERRPRGLLVYDEWAQAFSLAFDPPADLVGTTVVVGGEDLLVDDAIGLLTIPVEGQVVELLKDGVGLRLAADLQLRGGGEPLYLMTESVEAGGLLQERVPAIGQSYSMLLEETAVDPVRRALIETGVEGARARSGPASGWSWLGPIVFTRPVDDRAAAILGTASPSPPPRSRLDGGLRVATGAYLTGGAPDVLLHAEGHQAAILLDGKHLAQPAQDNWVLSLPQKSLGTGTHAISVGGEDLKFDIRTGYNSAPVDSTFGHEIEVGLGTPRVTGSSARPVELDAPAIRGALIEDALSTAPPRLRVLPGQEVLVLTDDGKIFQIVERPARWLEQAQLHPTVVELPAAVRGLMGVAFVLRRSIRTGRVDAIEVSASWEIPPGVVPHRERHDVTHDLLVPWHGLLRSAEARRSRALTAALGRNASPRTARPTQHDDAPGSLPPLAVDVDQPGALDELLRWLSELERGTTSTDRVRSTWGWLAPRWGAGDGSDWRLALFYLQNLGHIEVDYDRSRVGVAPAVANLLRGGSGLAVLCGARPGALLDTLTQGASPDPQVESALAHLVVHRRAQISTDGDPTGSTTIYLEWDPSHEEEVIAGLAAIGVRTVYAAGDALLGMLPGIDGRLAAGTRFTVPPSTQAKVKQSYRTDWSPARLLTARGLYRFVTRRGDIYAWRAAPDEPLVQVDRRLGPYLLQQGTADEGPRRRHLLHRDMQRSTLLVSRDASLTPLLARSLVLRTGLLPQPTKGPLNALGDRYLEYQNIDYHTAERLGELLKQPVNYL